MRIHRKAWGNSWTGASGKYLASVVPSGRDYSWTLYYDTGNIANGREPTLASAKRALNRAYDIHKRNARF